MATVTEMPDRCHLCQYPFSAVIQPVAPGDPRFLGDEAICETCLATRPGSVLLSPYQTGQLMRHANFLANMTLERLSPPLQIVEQVDDVVLIRQEYGAQERAGDVDEGDE